MLLQVTRLCIYLCLYLFLTPEELGFLTLSESQNGEVWLTIILETQLSLEKTFGTIAGECSGIFQITV